MPRVSITGRREWRRHSHGIKNVLSTWAPPNVYGDISAYFPKSLDSELVRAIDRQIRHRVMIGGNGLDLKRCVEELSELLLRHASKEHILRQNAIEFLGL